jgi:hypothetical protein
MHVPHRFSGIGWAAPLLTSLLSAHNHLADRAWTIGPDEPADAAPGGPGDSPAVS